MTTAPKPAALSSRASALLSAPDLPAYLLEHFARGDAPYDPVDHPDGYIPLCVAENRLVWDLIEPVVNTARQVPPAALAYDEMIGNQAFRAALASFMSRWFLGREVGAEHVAALAGAGSILETLFWILADPGEGVLVPTPSYAGFWMDLEGRDGLRIVPVHATADTDFQISTAQLDAAVEAADIPIRALLFTSPNNPLGTVYSPEALERLVRWAEHRDIHVVFDEVYALSVYGEAAFTSVASLRPSLGERVHIVWAFSKDFAASGLRCGVLVSENQAVLSAMGALSYWSACSGDTQHLLRAWLTDEAWLKIYVPTMRARLGRASQTVARCLEAHGIPFLPASAGFFVLLDLREHLPAPSWEGEERLWRHLLDRANLNLTPGVALRCAEPGLFRLCFAGVDEATLGVALHRLVEALRCTPDR